jgi:protein-disulfide isomerase
MPEESVKISKNFLYGIVAVCLIALLALYVMSGGFGAGKQPAKIAGGQNNSTTNVAGAKNQIAALLDDDMRLGSDSAPIVIVEFSDFQCPYCRKFWVENFQSLKTEYIDTGKVQLVYRDFPLGMHPSAEKAAEATECAADQGKGWEMHDKIYVEQAKSGQGTVSFSVDDMKGWASMIGIDTAKFDNCLDSGKMAVEVQKDIVDGTNSGVRGTPAFVIGKRNGSSIVPISGAQPYNVFKSMIDQMLQG